MTVFRERGGSCTRCWGAIGGNAAANMVWERVAHTMFVGGLAVHTDKWTPVCDACLTVKEQAAATRTRICVECAQRMTAPLTCVSEVCSSRCYQRRLRARHRASARAVCATCAQGFAPKRSDARYCSNACRQKAFRKAPAL